jgi:hypothetical protein
MKNFIIIVSFSLTVIDLNAQSLGFFGKRNIVEVNFGHRIVDIPRIWEFEATKASVNFGFSYRRQTSESKAIGISFTNGNISDIKNKAFMFCPSVDVFSGEFLGKTEYYGQSSKTVGLSRIAFFKEKSLKSTSLPIGLSNELGLGLVLFKLKSFSFTPTAKSGFVDGDFISGYENSGYRPTKSIFLKDDLNPDIAKFGIYVHWRVNLKIILTKRLLLNCSYLVNLPIYRQKSAFWKDYIGGGNFDFGSDEQKITFVTSDIYRNLVWSDLGTLKLGLMFTF